MNEKDAERWAAILASEPPPPQPPRIIREGRFPDPPRPVFIAPPRGHILSVRIHSGDEIIEYSLSAGGCDRWHVQGFFIVDGKPDLSRDAYRGEWKSRADADAELAAFAKGS